MYIIYCIRHIQSGMCYVGQTVQKLQARWRAHCNKNTCVHLYAAICEYGSSAFAVEVLEMCPEADLDNRERHWIATLDCIFPNGYNARNGGSKGRHSPETRAKMSKAKKGRKFSAEHRANLSTSHLGNTHTLESREKMSKAQKGKKKSPEHVAKVAAALTGKKLSPERIEKLRQINIGRKHTPEARANMSASKKGRKGKSPSAEARAKISATLMGHTISEETRAKLSIARRGEKNPNFGKKGKETSRFGKGKLTQHADEIFALADAGWTKKRIAQRYNAHITSVFRLLKRRKEFS